MEQTISSKVIGSSFLRVVIREGDGGRRNCVRGTVTCHICVSSSFPPRLKKSAYEPQDAYIRNKNGIKTLWPAKLLINIPTGVTVAQLHLGSS